MRAELGAALLTLCVAVSGCDASAPPPSSPPEPTTPPAPEAEPETAPAEPAQPAAECARSEVSTLLEDAAEDATLALRLGADGGLVVSLAEGAARARTLTSDGEASGQEQRVELPGARRLFGLEPFGDGYLVLATGSCAESSSCLLASELSAEGSAVGTVVAAALPGPITTARRAATEGRVYVAWSAAGERGLETYLGPGSLGRARRPLGEARASEELPVEILGLAARGDRFAALLRQGAGEDERARVFLSTDEGTASVEALHEALVVESFERGLRDATLIVGFEMSRPHLIRIAPGADEPTEARELAAGEPVPEPFEERVRVSLDLDDDALTLAYRDGMGDVVRPPQPVVAGAIGAAAVARRGGASLVAWVADGEVRARWVRCD